MNAAITAQKETITQLETALKLANLTLEMLVADAELKAALEEETAAPEKIDGMTEKETLVYNAAVEQCEDEYSTSAKELAEATGLDIKTIKGVVGSLCKKGHMQAEEEERGGKVFLDLWPVVDGQPLCYGNQ